MSEEGKTQKHRNEESIFQSPLPEGEVFDILVEATKKAYAEIAAEHWDEGTLKGTPSGGLIQVIQPHEASGRIPRQVSQKHIEELADYYDHTDTAELEDGEDVTDQVQFEGPDDMEQISIRLPREDLEQIRRRAKVAGVGYTTMIRMIVHAHLENPLTY